ncbi:MAG TPA: flavoprotein, partial [Burkholderiaceae bacterium]|nr:flavoprotein [Burkholderiaceae bacterium]
AELAKQVPGTRLVWSVRTPVLTRVFGGGDADALPARGALGASLRRLRDTGVLEFNAGLRITEIIQEGGKMVVAGIDGKSERLRIDGVDEIICATGQRPDLSLTSELRVKLDPWLESNEALGPLIDPNEHSCGTVRPHGHRELSHPEPGLYTVGVKSYGRAPTFLMATGFEQARSVVAAIAGDLEAADRVELSLPETGVCGVGESTLEGADCGAGCGAPEARAKATEPVDAVASGCCGGPAKADPSACCVLDEHMKSQGAVGCGCSQPKAPVAARAPTCCG